MSHGKTDRDYPYQVRAGKGGRFPGMLQARTTHEKSGLALRWSCGTIKALRLVGAQQRVRALAENPLFTKIVK